MCFTSKMNSDLDYNKLVEVLFITDCLFLFYVDQHFRKLITETLLEECQASSTLTMQWSPVC